MILGTVVYLAVGWGKRSFENFCPFGGIESLYALVTSRFITCAVSPWNFGVFFAVLGLTLVSRKTFCSWICPIGLIYELMSRVQRKLFGDRLTPPLAADRWLRHLRYVVLAIVLYFTWRTGELIFRGYDPYYLIFSGLGHGTLGTASIVILAILLVSGLLIRMSWCRYLCPMSAVMDLFSLPGFVVIKRKADLCTGCRACDESCAHDLRPSERTVITHRDCSNCLGCVYACAEQGCLSLSLHNRLGRAAS